MQVDEAYRRGVAVGRWLERGEPRCPVCDATQPDGHVLGCPVPDEPR